MYRTNDRVRIKMGISSRIEEVWGHPMRVVGREVRPYPMSNSPTRELYHCQFLKEGGTWFGDDGVVNIFRPEEIEPDLLVRKPAWEV